MHWATPFGRITNAITFFASFIICEALIILLYESRRFLWSTLPVFVFTITDLFCLHARLCGFAITGFVSPSRPWEHGGGRSDGGGDEPALDARCGGMSCGENGDMTFLRCRVV
ncbi:hypothetical protein JB92DRAFT_1780881 [Gautieria morchelliformis]|nr:hypothetical protein JB92DRAFT_1780881 [Gautieria morchelliformis]